MGILLVYDVTDEATFNNISNWLKQIDQHAVPNVKKVLIANKMDMPDDVKVLREVCTDRYEIDSLASYRNYYIQSKTHLANWKNRDVPEWFITK